MLEQLITFIFLYNFIQFLIWSTIIELIWPSNMFNYKHNYNSNKLKNRSFINFMLKLNNFTNFNCILNIFYFNQKLIKKIN